MDTGAPPPTTKREDVTGEVRPGSVRDTDLPVKGSEGRERDESGVSRRGEWWKVPFDVVDSCLERLPTGSVVGDFGWYPNRVVRPSSWFKGRERSLPFGDLIGDIVGLCPTRDQVRIRLEDV